MLIACMGMSAHANKITLKVLNGQGGQIERTILGRSFVLEVAINDCQEMIHKPEIKGLRKMQVRASGMYMNSINGNSTVKHRYTVNVDQPGTYKIGPAKIQYRGKTLTSNVITVVMGEGSEKSKVTNGTNTAFLRLLCNKKKAVIGERVPCALRFYFVDQGIELKNIGNPQLSEFTMEKAQGPFAGTEKIDDAVYDYLEWRWHIYPKKTGRHIISAYNADYQMQSEMDDYLGGLSIFLSRRGHKKRVY